jgi:hypothetical protein
MSITLYHAIIPSNLQILGAVSGLLDKAETYCAENNQPQETLTLAQLAPDMLPFNFQIGSVYHHSLGAIKGVRAGTFSPNTEALPTDFASLKTMIADAASAIGNLSEADINQLAGKAVKFVYGDFNMDFVAEDFLLSFSQPNFYFHATTAYNILRNKGLPVGKMDYMGRVRML